MRIGPALLLRCALALLLATIASAVIPVAGHAAPITFYTTKASFDAAVLTTLLEDFENTGATLNASLTSFSHNGVTYSGSPNVFIAGSPLNYLNWGADIPVVSGSQIASRVLTANGDENILATFSTPYAAVGFDAYFNGLGDGTLTVYGAGNVVLGSLTFAGGFNPVTGKSDKGYLGFTSSAAIHGFRWDTTNGGIKNTGFDNISVATSIGTPVPESSTIVLTCIGLAGFGALLRRRGFALSLRKLQ